MADASSHLSGHDRCRVYDWEQTRSQELLIEVGHPTLGRIALPGPPLRLGDGFLGEHTAPPTLDQHGDSIRGLAGRA
ncbi:hypothetical protein BH20ACT6_BH20ACT6_20680 [soil metagenome]